jgi:hypothetical protein
MNIETNEIGQQKGILAVLYSPGDTNYFIILQKKDTKEWILPKDTMKEGESYEDAVDRIIKENTGLSQYRITAKVPEVVKIKYHEAELEMQILLVEANINIPINIPMDMYDTYLWGSYSRMLEKLTYGQEVEIIENSNKFISQLNQE